MDDLFPSSLHPEAPQINDPSFAAQHGPAPPELLALLQGAARRGDAIGLMAHGAWSQQEDDLLASAVDRLGPSKWIDIAKFVVTRTSKQCRERWFNRLAPEIRHDPFEPWEDRIVIDSQRELGNRWAVIAQRIPGRSPCSVKNRWYSGLRNHHPTHAQIAFRPVDHAIVNQPFPGFTTEEDPHMTDL
jgi:hypothetical protein